MLPLYLRTPGIVKALYPGVRWEFPGAGKSVSLTFDDGPTQDVTPQVLAILDQFKAKATFFCIGRNVERNNAIYEAVLNAGHKAGNHTYSHLKGWRISNHEYLDDIELAARFIRSAYFRPPYGQLTPFQAKRLRHSYKIVMWSLLSYDFHPDVSAEKCLDHVIKHIRPGAVIVFHDSLKASKKMLYVLPRVLEHLGENGYGTDLLFSENDSELFHI